MDPERFDVEATPIFRLKRAKDFSAVVVNITHVTTVIRQLHLYPARLPSQVRDKSSTHARDPA
jgi:hypothetical protein